VDRRGRNSVTRFSARQNPGPDTGPADLFHGGRQQQNPNGGPSVSTPGCRLPIRPQVSNRGFQAALHSYLGGDPVRVELSVVPMISPEMIISTRRLACRPAEVLLSATGKVFPKPRAAT
jgi:hypothetical protein